MVEVRRRVLLRWNAQLGAPIEGEIAYGYPTERQPTLRFATSNGLAVRGADAVSGRMAVDSERR